jgi:hypothetical protein
MAHGHGSGSHAEDQPARLPPTEFDAFYPRGDIIAAAEDHTQAEAVVQALREAGFPDGDLEVLDAAFVLRSAEELHRRRGLLGRLGAIFGDDDYFAEQFVRLARTGRPIVVIHVPKRDDAKRAGAVLRAQGVKIASYYGRMAITDL